MGIINGNNNNCDIIVKHKSRNNNKKYYLRDREIIKYWMIRTNMDNIEIRIEKKGSLATAIAGDCL